MPAVDAPVRQLPTQPSIHPSIHPSASQLNSAGLDWTGLLLAIYLSSASSLRQQSSLIFLHKAYRGEVLWHFHFRSSLILSIFVQHCFVSVPLSPSFLIPSFTSQYNHDCSTRFNKLFAKHGWSGDPGRRWSPHRHPREFW